MHVYRVVTNAGGCGIPCDELLLVGSKWQGTHQKVPSQTLRESSIRFGSSLSGMLAGQAKHDAVVLSLGGNV